MSKITEALPKLGLATALAIGLAACTGDSGNAASSPSTAESLSPAEQRQRDAARAESARISAEALQRQRDELTQKLTVELEGIEQQQVAGRALSIIVTDYCDRSNETAGVHRASPPYEEPFAEAYEQYYPEYKETRLLTPDGAEWPETFTGATIQACSIPYAPGQYEDRPPSLG